MNKGKWVVSFIVVVLIATGGLLVLFAIRLSPDCETTVISVHEAPSTAWNAYLFKRDCGATTATAYGILLLRKGERFKFREGKVVFLCQNLETAEIRWLKDDLLDVSVTCGEVFKALDRFDGISIQLRNR